MDNLEKTPFESKKFVAFLISLIIISGILVVALILQTFNFAMSAFMCIGIAGVCALTIGYILSQQALDKFMRGLSNINPGSGGSGKCSCENCSCDKESDLSDDVLVDDTQDQPPDFKESDNSDV